jgi:transposase
VRVNIQELIAENQQLRQVNAQLKFELEQLKRLIFGQKSERFIPAQTLAAADQLSLFQEAPPMPQQTAPEMETITYQRRKSLPKDHPGRNPIPEHFPVEVVTLEPEEDVSGLVKIGEERTEIVEYTPASLVKKIIIRPKYAQPLEDGSTQVFIASLPARPIEKSYASASLLAHIITAKFVDHLPFYRQAKRFRRDYRWELSESTLGEWFLACCDLLQPLYEWMVRQALGSPYLQADESRIQVLSHERTDEKGKPLLPDKVPKDNQAGKSHRGWMWVVHAPLLRLVIFHYHKGRTQQAALDLLDNFKEGYLQVDGYDAYDPIAARPGVKRIGCWAHTRRKFFEALKNDPARAGHALGVIQQIYAHEDHCRHLSPEERKAYRDKHTRPLMDGFKYWLDEQAPFVTPKSPIGQAFTYAQNQWPNLYAILQDGRLELDNNLIENKIRPLALGRKNYLFAGSHDSARRIAMMYTFLGTCAANEVNPYEWLKSTLEKIPTTKLSELHTLVPGYKSLD